MKKKIKEQQLSVVVAWLSFSFCFRCDSDSHLWAGYDTCPARVREWRKGGVIVAVVGIVLLVVLKLMVVACGGYGGGNGGGELTTDEVGDVKGGKKKVP